MSQQYADEHNSKQLISLPVEEFVEFIASNIWASSNLLRQFILTRSDDDLLTLIKTLKPFLELNLCEVLLKDWKYFDELKQRQTIHHGTTNGPSPDSIWSLIIKDKNSITKATILLSNYPELASHLPGFCPPLYESEVEVKPAGEASAFQVSDV